MKTLQIPLDLRNESDYSWPWCHRIIEIQSSKYPRASKFLEVVFELTPYDRAVFLHDFPSLHVSIRELLKRLSYRLSRAWPSESLVNAVEAWMTQQDVVYYYEDYHILALTRAKNYCILEEQGFQGEVPDGDEPWRVDGGNQPSRRIFPGSCFHEGAKNGSTAYQTTAKAPRTHRLHKVDKRPDAPSIDFGG